MSKPAILSQLTGDSARARRTDTETSHKAADSITREATEDREFEVLAILSLAKHPLSDADIHEHHEARYHFGLANFSYEPSSTRTARKQLHALEYVALSATTVRSKKGREAQAWEITDRGRARLTDRNAA